MLSEIFYWILNISMIGGLTGLIVLVLRRFKKLPRFAAYALWSIPLIRFWIPFGIASRWSLINLLSRYAIKTVVIWERTPGMPDFSITNSLQAADSYFPVEYKTDLLETVFHVSSLVWIVATAAALLTAVMLYRFTQSELKSAKHIRDNIYQSEKVTAPAVYGILKPKIIIPDALTEGDIDYILMHERVHLRRKDNLWRFIAIVTACVHWFNPLVWVFLKCFLADMEFACDAKVVKQLDETRSKDYALAVLSAARGKAFFASAFGGAKTRVRIENILSYQKLTVFSSLCFAVLIMVIAVILTTNAVG